MGKALYCGCCGTKQEAGAEFDSDFDFLTYDEDFGDYLCPECSMDWEDYNDM